MWRFGLMIPVLVSPLVKRKTWSFYAQHHKVVSSALRTFSKSSTEQLCCFIFAHEQLIPSFFSLTDKVCFFWQKFRSAWVSVNVGCLKLSLNNCLQYLWLSANLESRTFFFFFALFEKEDHLKNALGIFLRLWFKILQSPEILEK